MSSETVDDNTISYMASDVIDEVLGDSSPAMPVFHSMYPLKVPTTQAQPVSVNLLKELAYQLMCRGKSTNAIIRKLVEVSTSSEDVSAQDLTTILADLVRGDFFQENDLTSLDQQQPNRAQPLFWVIDRIDRSFEQPKKPKRLYAFLHLLEGLVVASQGRLRILITSLYTPRRLDGRWEDNQADDDEGLKHFLEYVHKKA